MALTGAEIVEIAKEIEAVWDQQILDTFALDLGINLNNELSPHLRLKQRAIEFIQIMDQSRPPRDRELLESLRQQNNARLRDVANRLLTPNFVSRTGDPHDAIILGRKHFINRGELRVRLREFTNSSQYTTHVLIVSGEKPGGKSYSWELIRHLAVTSSGAVPMPFHLKDKSYTPREMVEQISLLLMLPPGIPSMSDDPQEARISPLINWFAGQLMGMPRPYWLVIDDLNDPSVKKPIREMAFALARCVEEIKPPNLWITLLGYNHPIYEPELRHIAKENARFPNAIELANHFVSISELSAKKWDYPNALNFAKVLLEKFSNLNKEDIFQLSIEVENICEKLKVGQHP